MKSGYTVHSIRFFIATAFLALPGAAGRVETSTPTRPVEVFVNVFQSHCIVCHGKWRQEAGLDLRTRESMLRGGKSGPALVPGKPEESLVLTRVTRDEMPPKEDLFGDKNYVRRVKAPDVELLRRWIAAGAPAPPTAGESDRGTEAPPSSEHWAFLPPQRPHLPSVQEPRRARNPIDAFLLERLEKEGLTFAPDAAPLTVLRRVTFAITGLSPTPEDVERFLGVVDGASDDRQGDALEREIDRLLGTVHFGEHWATSWLDSVGHADTHGKINRDEVRRYAWRYRDYVIRGLNTDKTYDRFLLEQIAGDELFDYRDKSAWTPDRREALIATGFLRTAADDTDELALNFVPSRMSVLNDQVASFSTAVLGLTMECARCHDHKFDPISQREYYRFSAIFRTAYDPYDWRIPGEVIYPPRFPVEERYRRLLDDLVGDELLELRRYNRPVEAQLAALEAQFAALETQLKRAIASQPNRDAAPNPRTPNPRTPNPRTPDPRTPDEGNDASENDDGQVKKLRQQIDAQRARLMRAPKILALFDTGGTPTPTHLLHRGDLRSPRVLVEPGVPAVFDRVVEAYEIVPPGYATDSSGRRLALARWLLHPEHPLTARVIVNRVWQQHFGRGLVLTPGNFGTTGSPPTHPKLLDWLAAEFVHNGWSLKRLHRSILTSTAYRQSSRVDPERQRRDPENKLLSRFPIRRLSSEEIRDTLLRVAGRLEPRPFGPADEIRETGDGDVFVDDTHGLRRSVYAIRRRLKPVTLLDLFGAPRLMSGCLKRVPATVPTQALQLWNSRLTNNCSQRMAARILSSAGAVPMAQLRAAYRVAFARTPTPEEEREDIATLLALRQRWKEEVGKAADEDEAAQKALSTFCHALLNAPEFIYVD